MIPGASRNAVSAGGEMVGLEEAAWWWRYFSEKRASVKYLCYMYL